MCITVVLYVVLCFQRVDYMLSVPVNFPVALFGSAARFNRKCVSSYHLMLRQSMEFFENYLVPFQKVAYSSR